MQSNWGVVCNSSAVAMEIPNCTTTILAPSSSYAVAIEIELFVATYYCTFFYLSNYY
jgi:hypothetical protein